MQVKMAVRTTVVTKRTGIEILVGTVVTWSTDFRRIHNSEYVEYLRVFQEYRSTELEILRKRRARRVQKTKCSRVL